MTEIKTTLEELCLEEAKYFSKKINNNDLTYLDEKFNSPNFFNDIIELSKKGILLEYTQPSKNNFFVKQKSFISFACEYEIGLKLFSKLLIDDKVYFSLQCYSELNPIYFDNLPDKIYNLTVFTNQKEYLAWNKNEYINGLKIKEPFICSLYKDEFDKDSVIYKKLVNSIHIFMVYKDCNENFSAPKKLLGLLNNI